MMSSLDNKDWRRGSFMGKSQKLIHSNKRRFRPQHYACKIMLEGVIDFLQYTVKACPMLIHSHLQELAIRQACKIKNGTCYNASNKWRFINLSVAHYPLSV